MNISNSNTIKNCDISVFFICNKKYFLGLITAITSILENSKSPERFLFYIIQEGFSVHNKKILTQTCNYRVKILESQIERFSEIKDENIYIVKDVLNKYLIPDIVPNLNKAIILDVDIIVCQDLQELWDENITDYLVGACEDVWLEIMDNHKQEVGLDWYFNSGVMIYNLEKMREHNTLDKLLEITKCLKSLYLDQDGQNLTFHDSVKHLPLKWNVQSCIYFNDYRSDSHSDDEIRGCIIKPGIVHFTGKHKCWSWKSRHPLNYLFYQYCGYTKSYLKYKALFLTRLINKLYISLHPIFFPYYMSAKKFIEN